MPTPKKIYHGWRNTGFPFGDEPYVTVNGKPLHFIEYCAGSHFEWGYEGNGPMNLAVSLLADHFGEKPTTQQLDQATCRIGRYFRAFMLYACVNFPNEEWTMSSTQIDAWIQRADAKRLQGAEGVGPS